MKYVKQHFVTGMKVSLPDVLNRMEDGIAAALSLIHIFSEEALDNVELLDALAAVQDSDVLSLGRTIRLLMGKEQTKKLYDHLRTEDGRVPVVALSNALGELMESFRAGKNSSSSPV